jgi:uncharacterized protein DUF1553/uncharacterized protein DUF1549
MVFLGPEGLVGRIPGSNRSETEGPIEMVNPMQRWYTLGKAALAAVVLMASFGALGAESEIVHPFESEGKGVAKKPIDTLVLSALHERGIRPANPCSDSVFIRRVYLDVIGTLPESREVIAFMKDKRPNKRALLINALLKRDEFADYWSLKWCDALRVKAEFPINLWPNAVQAYHRWVHDAMRENMPYDEFVREMLTASGSNFRMPQVNFYRAIQGKEPRAIAHAVALTFMGSRIEGWPEAQRTGMEAFFSRVAFKPTAEWKEEIICLDPAPAGLVEAVFPDGTAIKIPAGQDPRQVFADWLMRPDNPWLARSVVNRIWAWLFGRGIVHEADDIRADNPPVNPELLAYLEKELVKADYDLQHIYRLILNSRTYQQSSISRSGHEDAEALFAHYAVRRLDAEVLIDALCYVTASRENYSSPIPEPFTYIPNFQRTITLADGSISSAFLEMFGRPSRDTGLISERNNNSTDSQRLHMLNSSHVQQKIEKSWRLKNQFKAAKGNVRDAVRSLYLTVLSRYPTEAELATAEAYVKSGELKPLPAAADVVWALFNSKEFLYRH